MSFDPRDPRNRQPARRPGGDVPPSGGAGTPPRVSGQQNPQGRREPLRGEVLPPSPLEPYYPADDQSMLRNPYVLAGLAVAFAIVMAVVVVVLFGGGGDGNAGTGGSSGVQVRPLTPQSGQGGVATSAATATVREGPGDDYFEIGQLRSGLEVEVVGKNEDASWIEILFPPKSPNSLKGWVPSGALKLPGGGASALPVVSVTAISRPTIAPPTPVPTQVAQPTATITPTGTATALAAPDLAIAVLNNTCQQGTPLIVTLRNAGTVAVSSRQVRVTVSNQGGVLGVADSVVNIEPGGAINLATNQTVQGPRTTARLDIIGTPTDSNPANNTVDCVVSGGGGPTVVPPTPVGSGPTATRTPNSGSPAPTATPD